MRGHVEGRTAVTGQDRIRPARHGLLAWTVLTAGIWLAGCAGFDEFNWKKMNFEVFKEPADPVAVIRNSKDGAERARALRCLREPLGHGGSQQDQEAILALLKYSASHETQPLCRVAAIDALRKFRDPQAVDGLKEAYYRAGNFPPETATALRCQALTALGETKQPAAVDVLVRVLREPPVEGPDQDQQHKLNERATAARALGNFNQYEATGALVEVLQKEQNPALRNRAHESLVSATGRELPPDAQTWSDFLRDPQSAGKGTAGGPAVGKRILELTGLK